MKYKAFTLAGAMHVDLRPIKSKLAFTLAEVLITLGIIGVVAAMTIPNLMENVRNKDLQVQLKKTYSEWNQISMQFMEDHEQSIPDFVAEKGNGVFFNEIPKYLKGVNKFSDWMYDDTDEDGSKITTMPYKIYTLGGTRTSLMCDVSGFRSDIAGKYILFDDAPKSGHNGPRLCIDINGDKKPNKIGLDIFYFLFTTDGHIIPEGTDHLDNDYTTVYYAGGTLKAESRYCSGGENSLACTYYAINDKSPKGNGSYWKDFIGRKQYK